VEQVSRVLECCWSFSNADNSTGAILYGNAIYSIGSILIAAAAQVRSFRFMIAGRIIAALGDIATQIAQYKIFSSWFPPSSGFASTLGLELGIGKIGSFVGKSSANIIAKVSRASRFWRHIANLCVEHWQFCLGLLGRGLYVSAQSYDTEVATQLEAHSTSSGYE
jgi:MFS family permease